MSGHNKFRIIGVSLLFIGFIIFPLVNNFSGLVKDAANSENRALAKEPAFDINHLDPFPEQYEKYYNDHFSLRARFVKYFTKFNLKVYQRSPFPWAAVVGYHNWLYLAGGEFDCYLGKNRFSDAELEAYKQDLEFQKKYLEARGCKFYFMVTPAKANIHSENVPYSYFRYNEESFGEQLVNYLEKHSDINVINVFKPLRKLKEQDQLYLKHDNHWNPKGAFYAANMIATRIAKDFPNVKPLQLSDFTVKEKQITGGDIARVLGDPDSYEDISYDFISKKTNKPVDFTHINYALNDGVNPQFHVIDNKDTTKPKLLMISDSFSYLLFPFIAQSFGTSVNVFDHWEYKLMDDIVAREKPDVYLLMSYEAFTRKVPANIERFGKEKANKH